MLLDETDMFIWTLLEYWVTTMHASSLSQTSFTRLFYEVTQWQIAFLGVVIFVSYFDVLKIFDIGDELLQNRH